MATTLRTRAWQLIGLTQSVPGVLEIAAKNISFTTEEGRLFHLPLSELRNVHFPWYYFGGGIKFASSTEKYRFSFVRPNGADDVSARLMARTQYGGPFALWEVVVKFKDIREGRAIGRKWYAALSLAPK